MILQFRDVKRVRQTPDIKYQVGLIRYAITVTKGNDLDSQAFPVGLNEHVFNIFP